MPSSFSCFSCIWAWKVRSSFFSRFWESPRFISSSKAFGRRNIWKTSSGTKRNPNSISPKGKKASLKNERIFEKRQKSGGGTSSYQVGGAGLPGFEEPGAICFRFQSERRLQSLDGG